MPDTQKPHVSVTQVEMLGRCGEAYRRRYIEGDIIPPGIAPLIGTGLHVGAETNFRQKVDSHTDLPEDQIVEAAVTGFEARYDGDGCLFTEEEISRGAASVLGEAKDVTAKLAKLHALEQAPDYQPAQVEHATRIILPRASHDLLAVTDLRDDSDRIVDIKTRARKPPATAADESLQLTVYDAAFRIDHQRPPSELRLDVLTKTKQPGRHVFVSKRSQGDIRALVARINAMLAAIAAGAFVPCDTGHWSCNPKWCGYFRSCPYVNAERLAAARE